MAQKKIKMVQIAAAIALFAITLSIIGTGILVIMWNKSAPSKPDIQEFLKNYSGSTETASGNTIKNASGASNSAKALSWSTNK